MTHLIARLRDERALAINPVLDHRFDVLVHYPSSSRRSERASVSVSPVSLEIS